MKKFQIQFIDKAKSGSYKYFETDKDDYKEKAAEVANEYHEKKIQNQGLFNYYEPIKTVQVVEYDKINHKTLRGGIKFKLVLSFMEMEFKGGNKVKETFYIVKE